MLFNLVSLLKELFGKTKVVVHITRDAGESLKAQELLTHSGIKFDKEIEGMASTNLQMKTAYVSPVYKLKVNPDDISKAKEILNVLLSNEDQ